MTEAESTADPASVVVEVGPTVVVDPVVEELVVDVVVTSSLQAAPTNATPTSRNVLASTALIVGAPALLGGARPGFSGFPRCRSASRDADR